MAKPPERAELVIEGVGARGDGIARLGDRKVFVPFTLPGERVEARIVGTAPDGVLARAERWVVESPERGGAPCPHFGACGGCALQHWSDAGYAGWKLDLLRTAFRRHGIEAPIEPLRRTPPHARRRAGFVARFGGRWVKLGFRERASHRLVPVTACPVLRPALERFAVEAPPLLAGLDAPNAEWALDAGETETGIDLLVTAGREPDLRLREGLAALAERLDLARVSWRAREGAEAEPIAIRRTPLLRFAGVAVEPPPGAFFQASVEGEAALTEEVLAMTAGARRIADLYSGLGTFTLPLARRGADEVLAVEGDAAASGALATAARRGNLPVRTLVRDLARDPLRAEEMDGIDAVVLDPPRAGAKAQCAELAWSEVPVVAMVSCNPATFARDARTLIEGGWRLERVIPVDQFLWSPHLELVALLRR
jgi:23S rRNA (uracil1939-C5)-methyltransferase